MRAWIRCVVASAAFVSVGASASDRDLFWYTQVPGESVPLPTRYTSPSSEWVEPYPSAGGWRRRLDTVIDGPMHLHWRLCHGDALEQDHFAKAIRLASADGSLEPDVEERLALSLGGCGSSRADRRPLCDWMRSLVTSEPAGPVSRFFHGQFLSCAQPEDRALFEASTAPDFVVVSFHREIGPFGYSERLAEALRRSVERSDRYAVRDAVDAFSRVDDPRVANTILALHASSSDAEIRRLLALGLVHQSNASAFELYRREWRAQCEESRAARAAAGADGATLHALGYVIYDDRCDATALKHIPPPHPPAPRVATNSEFPSMVARRAALAPFALEEGITFSPEEAQAIGSHAPLMRRLVDRVSPDLDDLVLEEVWPALDEVSLDRGPVPAVALVDGLGFRITVRDETDVAQVAEDLRAALAKPHFVDAYLDGSRFRFALRPLGRRFDLETMVGALNQLLELRRSNQRLLLLAPPPGESWFEILIGPENRLLEAVRAGAARPVPIADGRGFLGR